MPKLTEDELNTKLEIAKRAIDENALYFHYKCSDRYYSILHIGYIEATEEPCVVYKAHYGKGFVWVRTVESFLANVETDQGVVARFQKLV